MDGSKYVVATALRCLKAKLYHDRQNQMLLMPGAFTEDELLAALRLIMAENEARDFLATLMRPQVASGAGIQKALVRRFGPTTCSYSCRS